MSYQGSNKLQLKISKLFDPVIQKISQEIFLLRYDKITLVISQVKKNLQLLINNANIYNTTKDLIVVDSNLDLSNIACKEKFTESYQIFADRVVNLISSVSFDKETIIEEMTNYINDLYINFRSEAYDIDDLLSLDIEARKNAIEDLIKTKISENHNNIVKKVEDNYAFSKNSKENFESLKAEEVSNLEELFRKQETTKYLSAVEILSSNEDKVAFITAEYHSKTEQIAMEYEYNNKLKNVLGRPKNHPSEYDLVKKQYLTEEQAILFDYRVLNIYASYHDIAQDSIKKLFEVAKAFHSDNPNRGIAELSKIDYTQAYYMLSDILLKSLRKRIISISQYINFTLEEKKIFAKLSDTNQVELVSKYGISASAVINAKCFEDFSTGTRVVETIRKIYEITEGSEKDKVEKAIETFAKILSNKLLLLKNDYQLYTVMMFKIDDELVKKSACFIEIESAYTAYELIKESHDLAIVPEKLSSALKMFNLISDCHDKNIMIAIGRYNINKSDVLSFKCFSSAVINVTMNILQKCYLQTEGINNKKLAVQKVLSLIKDAEHKYHIESIITHGLDHNIVTKAKCFEHNKEVSIEIINYLRKETVIQKRIDFFNSIKELSFAKISAVLTYKLPIEEIVSAKCFSNAECEVKSLKILAYINENDKSRLHTVYNLIKDCDTVDKINKQTKVL